MVVGCTTCCVVAQVACCGVCVCVCVCVCLSDWVVAGLQGLVGVVMGLVGVVLLLVIGMVIKVGVLLQNHPVGGQR